MPPMADANTKIVIVTIVGVAPLDSNAVAETPASSCAGVPLTQAAGNR